MMGGTFSITNVGVFGVDAGTPILNPGRGRHPRARRRAPSAVGAPRRDRAARRHDARLSFDHRLVDGEQGSRFLADVADILREPGRAMLLR